MNFELLVWGNGEVHLFYQDNITGNDVDICLGSERTVCCSVNDESLTPLALIGYLRELALHKDNQATG